MAAPSADPVTRLFDMTSRALSGDPEVLRGLAATLGAFSVRVLVALVILGLTLWAAKRAAAVVERGVGRLHRGQGSDQTLPRFIGGLAKYLVIAIGMVAVLQQLGVQATSVLAVLGAASLAIGLALQGTLGNVAAGVMILLLRPYRFGDTVELNGRQGVVQGMDLFNTRLLDAEGLTVFLPNGKVFGDMIVNVTRAGRRRIELVFNVDHDNDLDRALELLSTTAAQDPRVMRRPAPWAGVSAVGDSSVSVMLRCWTAAADFANARFDLMKSVKEAFDANGVSFPASSGALAPMPSEAVRRQLQRAP